MAALSWDQVFIAECASSVTLSKLQRTGIDGRAAAWGLGCRLHCSQVGWQSQSQPMRSVNRCLRTFQVHWPAKSLKTSLLLQTVAIHFLCAKYSLRLAQRKQFRKLNLIQTKGIGLEGITEVNCCASRGILGCAQGEHSPLSYWEGVPRGSGREGRSCLLGFALLAAL